MGIDGGTETAERRSTAVGVRCVEANTNGERPTGYWWCSSVPMPMKQRCSKRTQRRWGGVTACSTRSSCGRTSRKNGDSPIQSIVTGLHERNRKGILKGLRSFIQEDNHRAVDVGQDYPEASIREGTEELTFESWCGGHTAGLHQHSQYIEDDRWGPLVDADWHAFCQAIYKRGREWEELYCHFGVMGRATGAKGPGGGLKARALWATRAARDGGRNTVVRLAGMTFWEKRHDWSCGKKHRKHPIIALGRALKCLENSY